MEIYIGFDNWIYLITICAHKTAKKEVAFVGGGAYLQPGEISLSQNGVLFKDDQEIIKESQIVTPMLSHK